MGCGASAKKAKDADQEDSGAKPATVAVVGTSGTPTAPSAPVRDGAILVHSAKRLQEADWLLSASSDPYVICRLGKTGSAWKDKADSTERQSEIILNDVNPVWRLVFPFAIPDSESAKGWELHLRVYDKDLVSADEFLGEIRATIEELLAHWNELKEYKIISKPGVVTIMTGSRVTEALHEELKDAATLEKTHGWFSTWVIASKKLGQFFNDALATPHYYANLVRMANVWRAVIGDTTDKSFEWFQKRTTDPKSGVNSYKWNGPESDNSTTVTGHTECHDILTKVGTRFGTNNANGEAFKPNWLGFQRLNPLFWPELPWHGIGLSIPQETHAWIRPLLTKLSGPGGRWSSQWLTEHARKFFTGRETVVVGEDVRMWGTQVLHQVFLGLELSEQEANEFMGWQKKIIIGIGAPEAAVAPNILAPGLSGVFDMDGCVKFKMKCLERYKPLLKAQLPKETEKLNDADLTAFASSVMDALLFAGGQSVPSAIQFALAIPYSAWGQKNLPDGFSLDNPSTLPSYIWEVIRRFPPVSSFVFQERSSGSKPDQRVYLQLQMAQQDPRVWGGADSTKFVMRPIMEYHSKSVGFAEPSIAPRLDSPNAHSCPAKDLALAMILAFVREFARTAHNVKGGHKVMWSPRDPGDQDRALLKPEDITLNLFGTTRFTLHKDAAVLGPDQQKHSGAWLLEQLSEEEKANLQAHVHRENKMDGNDFATRAWTELVQLLVKPTSVSHSGDVGPPLQRTLSDGEFWAAPFGGLKFIVNNDEDNSTNRIASIGKFVLTKALFTDAAEDLAWFDSREEAVACMDVMFGKVLPPQFNSWEDVASDTGMRHLCICGVGSWYLSLAKSSSEAGHEVPESAKFECNLEYLSKYETRSNWMKYGHTAYLGASEEGSPLPGALVGIWSCHHQKLLAPGDPLWEHGKAGFRSSLCTSLTLREHLFHCHWVIANGLMLSARGSLDKNHPLRRLLKQFYFETASINDTSKDALLPLGALGHRTFAFSDGGWLSYFSDLCGAWKWQSFPERMKQTGLSPEVLEAMPLSTDGLLFWKTCEKYVEAYLRIFYPSDDSLAGDMQVAVFWSSFEGHFDTPWKLPELSFNSLVCLVTDLIWWVTGGHEFVGSIVEYLTALSGIMPKLVDGKDVPDVQSFTQALIIISLTGMREPPLMDEWTHLFQVPSWTTVQQQAVLDTVRQFQVDLATCSDEIEHRNMVRERRGEKICVAFDPRIMETSVSI